MTFKQFLQKVENTFMEHQAARMMIKEDFWPAGADQWRYGQTVMNVLHDVWHQKYLEITDSDLDCFYTNRNVALVLTKLEKEWHEKVS